MKVLRFKLQKLCYYRRFYLCFLALSIVCLSLFVFHKYAESRIVTFESRESKNTQGNAVLNQIKFTKQDDQDVWQMRQSHSMQKYGGGSCQEEFATADFIEIAVRNSDNTAVFKQFQPDAYDGIHVEREYSVPCGTCHSNGPRLIRPNWNSLRASVSFLDKVTIVLWNLKIKTYGQISATENPLAFGQGTSRFETVRSIPFSSDEKFWNAPLKIKSCTLCHQNRATEAVQYSWVPGFLKRNELTRQNFRSIRFLRAAKEMPPPLHSVDHQDQSALDFFLGAIPL